MGELSVGNPNVYVIDSESIKRFQEIKQFLRTHFANFVFDHSQTVKQNMKLLKGIPSESSHSLKTQ